MVACEAMVRTCLHMRAQARAGAHLSLTSDAPSSRSSREWYTGSGSLSATSSAVSWPAMPFLLPWLPAHMPPSLLLPSGPS